MARPIEKSIEYYPMNCNFLNDIKIRRIMKACGANSIAVLLYLLGNIYGDEGYYMRWNEDVAFLISDSCGVREGHVTEVIEKAIQVGFFDSEKFEKFGILTSKGIQSRYFKATEKRKNDHIIQKYLVVNSEITRVIDTETGVNDTETPVNVATSTQSKVKESKVKESKVKESKVNNKGDFSIFESVWSLYPHKKGKSAVSKKSKEAIQKLGLDAITNAVKHYKQDVENQRANGFTSLAYMQGSTFFNGRYTDYLDPSSITPLKAIPAKNTNTPSSQYKSGTEKTREVLERMMQNAEQF